MSATLPPIGGLNPAAHDVLSAIVAEAVQRGVWSFPYKARQWIVDAGLCPPDLPARGPQASEAMKVLDKCTRVLIQRGFLSYGPRGDPRQPRVWTIRRDAVTAAIATTGRNPDMPSDRTRA